MGCFVAATQNWLLTRNRWYETVALLLICFTLFRPGFWLDKLQAPFDGAAGRRIHRGRRGRSRRASTLRFRVNSQSRAGDDVEKVVRLTMRSGKTGAERLQAAGLSRCDAAATRSRCNRPLRQRRPRNTASPAATQITSVLVPAHRPSRYWFALPGILLLGIIILLQRKRQQLKPAIAT